MNQLTQNQQDIITQITNEFNKINDDYNTHEGGLIDLSPLIKELNADKIRRSEIELQNTINTKIFLDNVDKDIKRINDDLVKYDLVAYKKWTSNIRITTLKQFKRYYIETTEHIDISCRQKSDKVDFDSHINHIAKLDTSYEYKYYGGIFQSLEDIVGTNNFKSDMRQLILKQNS
jgi:hypothetical protein